MRRLALLALTTSLLAAAGCGGSDTPPAAAGSAPSDPVAAVVHQFLDAMRRGDGQAASKLLTPLALQRAQERNESLAPPGSPTATFKVGAPEIEQDEAIVKSVWTDVDVDGKPYNEEIICVLRNCDGQWRVYGMAQDLGPGRPPMVMDLERPDSVVAQPPAGTRQSPAPSGSEPSESVAGNPFDQAPQR
jgi:hypothetical protein